MMLRWYDRDGKPITQQQAAALSKDNPEYYRVARTRVFAPDDLETGWDISTVWLGFDHNYGRSGPPIIFETMVFALDSDGDEVEMQRYATLAEADQGHRAMVDRMKAQIEDPVVVEATDGMPDELPATEVAGEDFTP